MRVLINNLNLYYSPGLISRRQFDIFSYSFQKKALTFHAFSPNLHEMTKPIKQGKYFKMSSAENLYAQACRALTLVILMFKTDFSTNSQFYVVYDYTIAININNKAKKYLRTLTNCCNIFFSSDLISGCPCTLSHCIM